jgi:uncharacterized membrane protein
MVEYTAIIIACIGLMFFLIELAFNLNDSYDPLKILIIGVSFFVGALTLNLAKEISIQQGASTAIRSSLDTAYNVWLIITGLFLTYVVVYLIVKAWNTVSQKKSKLRMYDDDA